MKIDVFLLGDMAVPQFSQGGRALTLEERQKIADRRGVCLTCGIKTHNRKLLQKIPLENDDVHKGICIRCNPNNVPKQVYKEWDQRHRFAIVTRSQPSQVHPSGGPGGVGGGGGSMSGSNRSERSERRQRTLSANKMQDSGSLDQLLGSGSSPKSSNTHQTDPGIRTARPNSASVSIATPPSPPSLHSGTSRSMPYLGQGLVGTNLPQDRQDRQDRWHTILEDTSERNQRKPPSLPVQEEYKTPDVPKGANFKELVEAELSDSNLLKKILHQVRNAATDKSLLPALKLAVEAYPRDPRMLAVASGALWKVSAFGAKQDIENALTILMDALRLHPHDHDLPEWVLGVLASWAMNPANKTSIPQAGGIEAILDALNQHFALPTVLKWGARALHNLVVAHDGEYLEKEEREGLELEMLKNIRAIEENDGIRILLKAMKQHHNEPMPQWWAMKLLLEMLQSSSYTNTTARRMRSALCQQDFFQHSVKVVRARSSTCELVHLTTQLMSTMLVSIHLDEKQHYSSSNVTQASEEATQAFAAASECAPSLVEQMGDTMRQVDDDVLIQEAGCQLLAALSMRRDTVKDVPDAWLALGRAMQKLSQNHVVIQCGGWAVDHLALKLADDDDMARGLAMILQTLEALDACRAALGDTFSEEGEAKIAGDIPSSLPVVQAMCGLLAAALRIPTVDSSHLPLDVIRCVFELPCNARTIPAYGAAQRALEALAAVSPGAVDPLLEEVRPDALVDSFRQDPRTVSEHVITVAVRSIALRRKLLRSGLLAVATSFLREAGTREAQVLTLLDLVAVLAAADSEGMKVDLPPGLITTVEQLLRSNEASALVKTRTCLTLTNLVMSATTLTGNEEIDETVLGIAINTTDEALLVAALRAVWAIAHLKTEEFQVKGLGPMFKNVVVILTRYCSEQTPYRPNILLSCSGALAAIVRGSGFAPLQLEIEEIRAVITAGYKVIQNEETGGVEIIVNLLETMLHLCYIGEEFMIQSGVVVVVVDVMMRRGKSALVQDSGCKILAALSASGNLAAILGIVQTEGVEIASHALRDFQGNKDVAKNACKALAHLSDFDDEETKRILVSECISDVTVEVTMLHQDNVDVLENACQLLLNLSKNNVPNGPQMLEAIASTMRNHPVCSGLLEKCLGILSNLMQYNSGDIWIGQRACIDSVIQASQTFMDMPTILKPAFYILGAVCADRSAMELVTDLDGIPTLVNGMLHSIEYEEVQVVGCTCLAALACDPRNEVLLRGAGAVDALVYAMQAHYASQKVLKAAIETVSNLAVNAPLGSPAFCSDSLFNVTVGAMRRFRNKEDFLVVACQAMKNLLMSNENAVIVRRGEDDLRPVLEHMSQVSVQCADLSNEVRRLL